MAQKLLLEKDDMIKDGFVGFSWTTFFFGFWVPLFRKDFVSALVIFLISCIVGYIYPAAAFIVGIIVSFGYNKYYTENLIKQGFRPKDDYSLNLLKQHGIFVEQ
ncbi:MULTISPECIES: hypothetical protein [unclassified Fusobacterium]|uniref:hypothetical protein n=1 Tax=unclassified Fusobacterium TaxID=2648384 RepID=UPI001B8B8085|nr:MULTISPECIES: hypothetical protein [unclassified Fusobacterium]MBR8701706.1 hypothetical protein [Fusobacterium sp. DD45]MBR8711476.1 hypothetical protein [Fusobacterium sp. DD28]MBR8752036.1 hypothetical protein [Fusobacterium sp. DD26]